LRELTEQALLEQVAPAGALVNKLWRHPLSPRSHRPVPGPASGEAGVNNILKMAREGLRHELTTGLRSAARAREIVRRPGLRVKTNGDFISVNLTIRPLAPDRAAQAQAGPAATPETLLYLVILEQRRPSTPDRQDGRRPGSRYRRGRPGYGRRRASWRSSKSCGPRKNTSGSPLRSWRPPTKSSGPTTLRCSRSMRSLQSTNEELETSKEELQIAQRGAGHGQRRAANQGGRPVAGQQ